MRLFFLDIDGTIAMPGTPPSPATVQSIQAARAKGNKVFLSTGRTEASVPQAIRVLEFDGGIYSAGAKIVIDNTEIFCVAMAPDLVQHVIQVMYKAGVSFNLECSSTVYRFAPPDYLSFLQGIPATGMNSELKRLLIQTQTDPNFANIGDYSGEPVFKIGFTATSREQINEIKRTIPNDAKVVSFENLMSELPVTVGEVSDRSVNKGAALQQVCAYLGATPEQCVAFGDSMNDAEILQAAGTGIAMGNSNEEVKLLADQVCGRCEEDGLAKAMLKLIR